MATSYICPYCGKEIAPSEVLFTYNAPNNPFFQDEVRYAFLFKCSADYPFENMDRFHDVYFMCDEPNEVVQSDENGFPIELRARPCDGLTPAELTGEVVNETETTEKSTDEEPILLGSRACPHCHCHLPSDFGTIPTFRVCLFGGRAAGKTAYLASLLQQLNKQLMACGLGTVSLEEESQRYFAPQMKVYNETGVTVPTPVLSKLFPLVLRYINTKTDKGCYIILYDIAGEGILNSNEIVDETYLAGHEGLRKAETVILMLDPNMLCEGAFFHAFNKANGELDGEAFMQYEEAGAAHDYCDIPLESFLAQTYIINKYLDCKHVLGVVTKMDQPLTVDALYFDPPTCQIKQNNIKEKHAGFVNTSELQNVCMELTNYINQKMGVNADIRGQIVHAFKSKVKNPLLLGVSTYTRVDNDDGSYRFMNLYDKNSAKHRIIEPFLALLYIFGMAGGGANAEEAEAASLEAQQDKTKKKKRFLGIF